MKPMQLVRGGALLAVVAAMSAPMPAGAQDRLRWSLQEGQQFHVSLQQEQQTRTIVDGNTVGMELTMTMELDWEVVAFEELDTVRLKQRIRRVVIHLESDSSADLDYDSDAEIAEGTPAAELDETVRPLLEAEVFVTLSDRGEVVSVELDDGVRQRLEEAGDLWRDLLSDDGWRSVLQRVVPIYPEDPIGAGGQWTAELRVPTPLGLLRMVTTYEHAGEGESAGTVRIEAASDLTLENTGSETPLRLLDPRQEGSLTVRTDAGYVAESSWEQAFVTELPYAGRTIRVEVDGTLQMTVEPVDGGDEPPE